MNEKMKKIYVYLMMTVVVITLSFFASSCNKNDLEAPLQASLVDVRDGQSALENFSISLSKAVYAYPEVREFLKSEAMKRFDNDDEVFYPFVKDREVGTLGTFREILVRELGSEELMKQIEEKVLSLTILVSDATWFDSEGFCLDRWDTSDSYVAITYREGDGFCRKLFGNGCLIGAIEKGTIPGGPVLIVKENERVVASVPTKGGTVNYTFISDAFNASKNQPKTKDNYSWEWLNEAQGNNSNIVNASTLNSINPDIITAYNLFKNNSYACQNDYIYYGMTSDASVGRLRKDVRNKIYRFKLNPDAFESVFDDIERNYVNYYGIDDGGKGYNMQDSQATVYARLWADGCLEIRFTIMAGSKGNSSEAYSVRARDLFTVKNNIVKKEEWGATLFKWYINWRYSFNESGDYKRNSTSLNAKWYYPNDNFTLPEWDLPNLSSYSLKVEEIDRGVTHYDEITVTYKIASSTTEKFNYEYDASGENYEQVGKTELGWSGNDEISMSEKQSIQWTDKDDFLGSPIVSYSDKYVKMATSSSQYELYTYGSNLFEFTILPYRY